VLVITAILWFGITEKYSTSPAFIRMLDVVAVGEAPKAIEQIESVSTRTMAVFALNALVTAVLEPLIVIVCSAIGGALAMPTH
jgi:hypothetical protein